MGHLTKCVFLLLVVISILHAAKIPSQYDEDDDNYTPARSDRKSIKKKSTYESNSYDDNADEESYDEPVYEAPKKPAKKPKKPAPSYEEEEPAYKPMRKQKMPSPSYEEADDGYEQTPKYKPAASYKKPAKPPALIVEVIAYNPNKKKY